MFLKTARAIAKPQTFAILDLLKRSEGLSVNEIAKSLKLSYMGVKQYCNELEKKGMIDTWRRPKDTGRPEMSYRLTEKANSLYPEVGNELALNLLETSQQLFGANAAERLLYGWFTKKTEGYLKKIKGETASERAESFAKLRDQEGCCAQVEVDHANGFRVVEFHSPLKEIAAKYPSVLVMEEKMFSRILGVPVERSERRQSGLVRIEFLIGISSQEFAKLLNLTPSPLARPEVEVETPMSVEDLALVETESEAGMMCAEETHAQEQETHAQEQETHAQEQFAPVVESIAEEPEIDWNINPQTPTEPIFKAEKSYVEFLMVG